MPGLRAEITQVELEMASHFPVWTRSHQGSQGDVTQEGAGTAGNCDCVLAGWQDGVEEPSSATGRRSGGLW